LDLDGLPRPACGAYRKSAHGNALHRDLVDGLAVVMEVLVGSHKVLSCHSIALKREKNSDRKAGPAPDHGK